MSYATWAILPLITESAEGATGSEIYWRTFSGLRGGRHELGVLLVLVHGTEGHMLLGVHVGLAQGDEPGVVVHLDLVETGRESGRHVQNRRFRIQ